LNARCSLANSFDKNYFTGILKSISAGG